MNWGVFLSSLYKKECKENFVQEFPEAAEHTSGFIYKEFVRRKSRKRELVSKRCSNWILRDLKECIHLDDFRKLNIGTNEVIIDTSMEDIINGNLKMFQIDSTTPNRDEILKKECSVRTFIDFMLKKLRGYLHFGIREEESINLENLPVCTFDYVIYNSGKPIGCLEAKSSSKMKSKAFVQSVVELFVLQKYASEKGVDVKKVPLFNILTDGQRCVLLQVKGDKILVEQNERNHLKTHIDGVMESLYRLIQTSVDASVE